MVDKTPLLSSASNGSANQIRTKEARSAFSENDPFKSRAAHEKAASQAELGETQVAHPEQTLQEGKLVKPFVFGGVDGVSTVFAVLAGGCGVRLEPWYLLAMGAANVLAGAFSMAVGEYLSSVGERDVAQREMDRERWEVQNYPQGEIAEMRQLYMQNGLSSEDADTVAKILSKYEDFWVEHMLLTEIGMLPPDDENPLKASCVMFISFFIFGSLPLVVFGICNYHFMVACSPDCDADEMLPFYISAAFTLVALFMLGAIKSGIADQGILSGGLLMAVQGSTAGALAYWAANHFA
jgi:DNA damage-binding protein 1